MFMATHFCERGSVIEGFARPLRVSFIAIEQASDQTS